MRLFHVSEDPNIRVFEPRLPRRQDLDPSVGLVWAVEEAFLPLMLLPRDCPRVAYRAGERATPEDRAHFFSCAGSSFVVAIESAWFERMRDATLCIYEFDPADFVLQDAIVGFYAAKTAQRPIARNELRDVIGEQLRRKVELRVMDRLWELAEAVQQSSLDWYLSRMRLAQV